MVFKRIAMPNKYVKHGLIIGMVLLVCLVLVYLLGIKTYSGFQEEASQAYQKDLTIFDTTPTVRLPYFESTLKTLQQFGGGDVIFEGGEGFVRFRVSQNGNLVIMVPVFASVPTILSNTTIAFMVDLRINTLQTGAVGNRTYLVGLNAVRLGNRTYRKRKHPFIFRIHHSLNLYHFPHLPSLYLQS